MRLLDLAQVLREAGINVIEEYGLSRPGNQLVPWTQMGVKDFKGDGPTHLMIHHTASQTTPQNDVNYCNKTSDIRPLTQILLDRSGTARICASGTANTNGKGSGFGVPDNSMNDYAIAIEIANNGVGEPYPKVQQDAVLACSVALCKRYPIPVGNIHGHFEWTSRKIDPSGPSRWNNNSNIKWNMDAFRGDVFNALNTPNPPTNGDDMKILDEPQRVFDSRVYGWLPVGVHTVPVPFNTDAVSVTLTAISVGQPGFATAWSGKNPNVPTASCLNWPGRNGESIANTTQVAVNNGSFKIYVQTPVNIVVDVVGYQ